MTTEHDDGADTPVKPVKIYDAWPHEGPEWAPRRWILPGWLPAGKVIALQDDGWIVDKCLAMQLAVAVALGESRAWPSESQDLGPELDAAECGPVLWASWETAPRGFQLGLDACTLDVDGGIAALRERLAYANMRPYGPIWGPGEGQPISTTGGPLPAWDALLNAAQERETRLLVLESVEHVFACAKKKRARAFLTRLADWADGANCAVLITGRPEYSGAIKVLENEGLVWKLRNCRCYDCREGRCETENFVLSGRRYSTESLSMRWSNSRRILTLVSTHERK